MTKTKIKAILIRRDKETEESAQELIDQTQEEVNDIVNEGGGAGSGLSDIEDAIQNNLGLEPDFVFCFLEGAC